MKRLPEEKLIDLAVEGVEDAWRELYRRYYGRVRRIVAWGRWGFRFAEIEEVIQEVFLELLKALPNFRHEATLSTFLTRLAKNRCISILRQKGAQKRVREEYGFVFDEKGSDEDEKWIAVQSELAEPEKMTLFNEDAMEISKSLQELTFECREIIRKRYFQDLSYNEICEGLGLPLGTVCSRLKRCLLKFKEIHLKKYGKVYG